MLSLRQSLREYLSEIGQLDTPSLGGGGRQRPITEQDSQFLRETLGHSMTSSDWIISVAVGLLVCLFGVGIYLILNNRDSNLTMAGITGGTFASSMAIIRYLLRIWSEKNKMQILILNSYALEPKVLAKLAATLYFNDFDTRPGTTRVHRRAQSRA
jgi:hypothetical protein